MPKREQIPGAEDKEWDALEKDCQIFRQEGKAYPECALEASLALLITRL